MKIHLKSMKIRVIFVPTLWGSAAPSRSRSLFLMSFHWLALTWPASQEHFFGCVCGLWFIINGSCPAHGSSAPCWTLLLIPIASLNRPLPGGRIQCTLPHSCFDSWISTLLPSTFRTMPCSDFQLLPRCRSGSDLYFRAASQMSVDHEFSWTTQPAVPGHPPLPTRLIGLILSDPLLSRLLGPGPPCSFFFWVCLSFIEYGCYVSCAPLQVLQPTAELKLSYMSIY